MQKVFTFISFFCLVVASGVALYLFPSNSGMQVSHEKMLIDNATIDTSCDGGSCSSNSLIPSSEEIQTVSADNWQFSLFGEGWASREPTSPQIKFMAENVAHNCLVAVSQEETHETYGQYIVRLTRSIVDDNNKIDTISHDVINGNHFVELKSSGEETVAWDWLTVKDGFGYAFSCGGEGNDGGNSLYQLCRSVAETIEIK